MEGGHRVLFEYGFSREIDAFYVDFMEFERRVIWLKRVKDACSNFFENRTLVTIFLKNNCFSEFLGLCEMRRRDCV